MHYYFEVFGKMIPGYSLMILLGLALANIGAVIVIKRNKMDINDYFLFEAYILLGAILGAKALYLWVTRNDIEWGKFFEFEYFNLLMRGGFVFYGGLIGGIVISFLGCKIHKINFVYYMRKLVFLIPFVHAFGRVGCFMAGCCYGVPYTGIFSVQFPKGSLAPANIPLFPVQLLEAFFLLLLAAIVWIISVKKENNSCILAYIIGYSILRFIIEFLRYDDARGEWMGFSTSQWISLFLIVFVIFAISINYMRRTQGKIISKKNKK